MLSTQHVLVVFDLETTPDRAVIPEEKQADPDYFPRPIQHVVTCAGVLIARAEPFESRYAYRVDRLSSPHTGDRSERDLVQGFWRMVDRYRPRVVGWNSRGFDVPVMRARAMVHGVQAFHWHQSNRFGYEYRFQSDHHVDVMDALSSFGASSNTGLEATALACGFPGKLLDGGGASVEVLAEEGRFEEIAAYCEGDVLLTYLLFLRWAFMTGELSAASHNRSVDSLIEYLERESEKRPHLGQFLETWRSGERPCPMHVQPPPGSSPAINEHLRSEDV